jgi:capsular polysaccharide transport system permease protein
MDLKNLPPTPERRDAWHIQRAVVVALVIRELRARVQGQWLSLMWMVLEPLAHVMVILALLGSRSHFVSINLEYPVFLVTGLLPFFIFRNLARRLSKSISANKGLFAYRQVKPIDALVARAFVEVGLWSMVYVAALALLGWMGYHWFPQSPLELAGISIVLILLGVSFGLLFAVIAHNRQRVETVIGLIFYPLYFASGVIFPVNNLSPSVKEILLLNPVLHLIELSRAYFLPNYTALQGVDPAYPAAWALVLGALSMSMYRVYRFQFVARA